MKEAVTNSSEPKPAPRAAVQDLVFFILFYLYLWLEVDLRLMDHGGPAIVGFPAFFKGGEFFHPFLLHPGGLLDYLSAFLVQFFRFSWAGALIVTVQAWLISRCTVVFLEAVNAHPLRGSRFIGPILLLVLYAGYTYHFNVTMMVLGGMSLACVYVKLRPESGRKAMALFVVLHVIAYAVTAGGHLLFAALCAVCELRRWRIVLGCLGSVVVVPYVVGCLLFGVAYGQAFAYSLFAPLTPSVYGLYTAVVAKLSLLYLFLPLAAFAGWLWRNRKGAGSAALRIAGTAAPFVAGAIVILLFRNRDVRDELEIGYHAYHRNWPEVMEIAEGLTEERRYPNPCVIHTFARALYHTDRLGRDMLPHVRYPVVLLLPWGSFSDVYENWYRYDTLLDLGHVNLAELHLNKSMESFGPRPIYLKRLALVHMVKGDLPTAKVYLNAVAGTLFDADWAVRYLELLKTDPGLSTDREIQRLRGLRVEKDRAFVPVQDDKSRGFHGFEQMLLELLDKEPGNRMAFEYLMALYLLYKRPEGVERNLVHAKRFGYPRIPRLYQEAVLVCALIRRERLDSVRFEIDPDVRGRGERFIMAFNRFRRDGNQRHLDGFEDSYFFYYFSGS
jgi:hypothetical protein